LPGQDNSAELEIEVQEMRLLEQRFDSTERIRAEQNVARKKHETISDLKRNLRALGPDSYYRYFIFMILPLIPVYCNCALLIKPEPAVDVSSDDESEFYESYVSSRTLALQRLKKHFDNLDRRIQRMEDVVTRRDYTWEDKMKD
jgi:hypothetical protein